MAKTDLYLDAQNQCIVIRRIDDAGADIENYPQVRISLGDLQNAGQPDEMPIAAVFRRVHFTDSNDGAKKRCYGLLTMPEDDSADDGHSSAEEDLYLGGSGAVGLYIITGVADSDYVRCNKADEAGVAVDNTEYKVAKPVGLRDSQQPIAEWGASVWPPYKAGQLLFVAHSDHTAAVDDEAQVYTELTLLDVNADGRALAYEFHWKDATTCEERKAWVVMSRHVGVNDALPTE